jgi:hypothetical protein
LLSCFDIGCEFVELFFQLLEGKFPFERISEHPMTPEDLFRELQVDRPHINFSTVIKCKAFYLILRCGFGKPLLPLPY